MDSFQVIKLPFTGFQNGYSFKHFSGMNVKEKRSSSRTMLTVRPTTLLIATLLLLLLKAATEATPPSLTSPQRHLDLQHLLTDLDAGTSQHHACGWLTVSFVTLDLLDYSSFSSVATPTYLYSTLPELLKGTLRALPPRPAYPIPQIGYRHLRCFRRVIAMNPVGAFSTFVDPWASDMNTFIQAILPMREVARTFHTSYDLVLMTDEEMTFAMGINVKSRQYGRITGLFATRPYAPMIMIATYRYNDTRGLQRGGGPAPSPLVPFRRLIIYCEYCPGVHFIIAGPPSPTNVLQQVAECNPKCPSGIIDLYRKVTSNGDKILWSFNMEALDGSDIEMFPVPYGAAIPSPFDLSAIVPTSKAVHHFIGNALNGTMINIHSPDALPSDIPSIGYNPMYESTCLSPKVGMRVPSEVGRFQGFMFITSDSVKKVVRDNPFQIYAEAFTKDSWIGLVTAIGVTAGLIALLMVVELLTSTKSLGDVNRSLATAIVGMIGSAHYWLFEILLEQVSQPSPEAAKSTVLRFCSVIASAWFMMSIILTNGYRGMIRSEFMTTPGFVTNWTNIETLLYSNFTIYQPILEHDCADLDYVTSMYQNDTLNKNKFSSLMQLYCLPRGPFVSESVNRKPYCLFYDSIQNAYAQSRSNVYRDMLMSHQIRPLCAGAEFMRPVEESLARPKTAIVVPFELAAHYNKTFRFINLNVLATKRRDIAARFAVQNTGQAPDWIFPPIFNRVQRMCYTDAANDNLGTKVSSRVAALYSSGLLAFWRKWEELRAGVPVYFGPRRAPEYSQAELIRSLAFANSDIHLPFVFWAGCLAMALLAFSVELIRSVA